MLASGFDAEIGSRVFLNTDGSACALETEQRVNEQLLTLVTLSVHDDEVALLDAIIAFVDATIAHRDVKLVAVGHGEVDPFTRSSEAIEAWQTGDVDDEKRESLSALTQAIADDVEVTV
jgi:hypothetical protein